MSAVCGRLRPCNIFDWKFTVLSHNTIRGAAGAAVLNGELLKAQGYMGDYKLCQAHAQGRPRDSVWFDSVKFQFCSCSSLAFLRASAPPR